ncbi:extracellular solute-binding protein [Muricoccus radiodurans]|uniref:extracellular solute-binding protein n=1 Tax=Muricoccus radiodurans TaxID=2231721 RepID=UPI003CF05101
MPISRRQLGLAGGLLAAPFVRPAIAQDRTFTLAAYSGVFEENYRAAVVEPFLRSHPGIRINYFGMPNSAQMLGTLRAQKAAPQIDAVLFDLTFAKAATDEGLFEPIPRDSMPVLAELDQERAFPAGVPSPAVTFDHLALTFSPERVQPRPDSWRVLWDPRYRGKVAFAGVPDLGGISIVLLANMMEGERDYMRSIDRGIASVAQMAPNVLNFDPKPDSYAFIVNGTSSLGYGWNARAQLYAKANPGQIEGIVPKEGSVAILNTINLVKGAAQSDAAKAFIAYALGAEAQGAFAERMYYGPVNTKVTLSPEAASRIASQEQRAAWLPVNWLEVARIRDRINEQWRRRVLTAAR